MKFRTFKYNIIRAIKVINHAVNAETMKMLGGILIDANAPDMVELTAYSNDIKIKYYVHADVEQKGTVVCNPKYLMNISKGENMEVIISTDKDNVIEMKIGTYISTHTLRGERDTLFHIFLPLLIISTHTLRGERDTQ